MPSPQRPQNVLGAIIRRQRELAELPMRQLAASVGISNPYLSQIERGLRAPSNAVLEAILASLDLSMEQVFAEAGYLAPRADDGDVADPVLEALKASTQLTAGQRRALSETYLAFLDANTVRRRPQP